MSSHVWRLRRPHHRDHEHTTLVWRMVRDTRLWRLISIGDARRDGREANATRAKERREAAVACWLTHDSDGSIAACRAAARDDPFAGERRFYMEPRISKHLRGRQAKRNRKERGE